MIKSMTAYAAASHLESCIQCDIEIRSYNSRHLDIALYLPRSFSRYEDGVKKLVAARLARGRIEIRIAIEDQSEDAVQFQVDESRAEAYYNALLQLKSKFNLKPDISIENLLDGKDMIKPAEKNQNNDQNKERGNDSDKDQNQDQNDDLPWQAISRAMGMALNELDAMRASEGSNLAADLLERIDCMEKALNQVESEASCLPRIYKARLMERIATLTSGMEEFDPVRLSQEAALLADKSDISEEIVRARSHVTLFREILSSPEPGGRKLNFLIQEFNREFNTMGSKAGRAELSHMIVELKSDLEKIREQVQNIE